MFKKTQAMLENFSDKEIRYMLQYSKTYLENNRFKPSDGTLQGSMLERINKVISESRR